MSPSKLLLFLLIIYFCESQSKTDPLDELNFNFNISIRVAQKMERKLQDYQSDEDEISRPCVDISFDCLASPGYPHKYPNNIDTERNRSVAAGQSIQVSFVDFNIEAGKKGSNPECLNDYVEFFDADGNSVAGRLCGTSLPKDIIIPTSSMTVRFHSNGNVNKVGYKFCYSSGCKTVHGAECKFPFEHKHKSYSSCIDDGINEPWCYTQSGTKDTCNKNCPTTGVKSCQLTPFDDMGPFYVSKDLTIETKCIAYSRDNPKPGTCDDDEFWTEPIRIQGRILDSNCNPVHGAVIEYWQGAPRWSVSHPNQYTMVDSSCTGLDNASPSTEFNCVHTICNDQVCKDSGFEQQCIKDMEYRAYRGWQTAAHGNYQINTVRPAVYEIRPIRHLHIKVTVPGRKIGGKDEFLTQLYLPQDEPTQFDVYRRYLAYCQFYLVKPGLWAKKQQLHTCPVRRDTDPGTDMPQLDLTLFNWDIVLDI